MMATVHPLPQHVLPMKSKTVMEIASSLPTLVMGPATTAHGTILTVLSTTTMMATVHPTTTTCASYEIEDCNGKCILASYLGDGTCDNSTWYNLDCAQHNYDDGDCTPLPQHVLPMKSKTVMEIVSSLPTLVMGPATIAHGIILTVPSTTTMTETVHQQPYQQNVALRCICMTARPMGGTAPISMYMKTICGLLNTR